MALGLFGGAGATLVWELIIRPGRARRAFAEVLFVENSHNIQVLAATIAHQTLPVIPNDFYVQVTVFEVLLSELALLPPRLVGDVSHLYARLYSLNRMRDTYDASITERRQAVAGSLLEQEIAKDLAQTRLVFHTQVESTLAFASTVQKALEREAYPWWSVRSWQREQSSALSPEQMQSRVQDLRDRQEKMRTKLGV